MSDRVARRRAEVRERIFTQAMRLFVERGFDAVTVAEIADAAEIAKGTFFTHFPSKRDIFRYLGEQLVDVMEKQAPTQGGARHRIDTALNAAATWMEDNADLARMMLQSRSFNFSSDIGSPSQQRFASLITEALTLGVNSGELRANLPISDAVVLIQGIWYVNVIQWAASTSDRPLKDYIHSALDIVFQGAE
ncbi:MAG: TetR/AcrR family transcriptional regulator [Actinomycetaceae bacterium]|nr:TetR/AcrR family transcriptional regulator [Actinomycetaceae bacterium]